MHIAYDNKQMTVNTFKNIQETGKDTYAKRNIGIEILRSLAMFMVIILHVLNFGINYEELVPFTVNFTLEIYVFHIALRRVLLYLLPMVGIDLVAYRQIIPFGLVYVPLSIFGGYILSLIVNRIK